MQVQALNDLEILNAPFVHTKGQVYSRIIQDSKVLKLLNSNSNYNAVIVPDSSSININHGLNAYPWIWFRRTDGNLLTPFNFETSYTDADNMSVDFINSTGLLCLYTNTVVGSVSVTSSSTITETHNNAWNPFVWFKNSNGVIETPVNFKLEYAADKNSWTVTFSEARTGTLYYGISSSQANTVSISSGVSVKKVLHYLSKYPFVWFERDSDHVVFTPANFKVLLSNMSKIESRFSDSLNYNYTLYYK